jgi:hypothetical protein
MAMVKLTENGYTLKKTISCLGYSKKAFELSYWPKKLKGKLHQ